jgi:hypothetical protein
VRPLIVLLSTLIIIATLALAYFAGPQVVSSGTVTASTSDYLTVSPASDPLSFTGNVPLTVNYAHLPSGDDLRVYVCPSDDTQTACIASNSNYYDLTAPKGALTVQVAGNMMLLLHTVAPGLTYSVTAPVWSLYSTLFVVLAVAALAVLIVGLVLKPAEPTTRYAPEPEQPPMETQSPPEEPAPPQEEPVPEWQETDPNEEPHPQHAEGGDEDA